MISEKVLEQCVELVRKNLTEAREAHIQMLAAKEELSILSEKMENLAKEYRLSINEVCDRHMKELVEKDELIARLQEENEALCRQIGFMNDAKAQEELENQSESGHSAEIPESQSTEFKIGDRVDHKDERTGKWGTNYIFKGPDPRFEGFCMIQLSPFREKSVRFDSIRLTQSTEKKDFNMGDKVDMRCYNETRGQYWDTGYSIMLVDLTSRPTRYRLSHSKNTGNYYVEGHELRLTPPSTEKEEPISVTQETGVVGKRMALFHKGDTVDRFIDGEWKSGYYIFMVDKITHPWIQYGVAPSINPKSEDSHFTDGKDVRATEFWDEQI